MELVILRHLEMCQSSKKTERKKSVIELTNLINDPVVIQVLNDNFGTDRVSWNALFVAVNHSLILESENWKIGEAKCSSSESLKTSQANSKKLFVALVRDVLTKSNRAKLTIKCEDIVGACVKIFSDPYLLQNFGSHYVSILQKDVLPIRKYRTRIKTDQWDELFQYVLDYLKTQDKDSMCSSMYSVIDLMESVVYYGCQQSHLSTTVKCKLLPYLQAEFNTLSKNPAIQNALLSLTLRTCITVAKDTRTEVCQLGESIIHLVIRMHDPKNVDSDCRNKLVVDFLLFQVQCHHPKGAKQGSDAAYAYDWNTWTRHMWDIYCVVFKTIYKRGKCGESKCLSDSFLDLCVELCHQLYDTSKMTYEVSISINDTAMGPSQGPAAKRRKCMTSLQDLFDELQSGQDASCWPLIALVAKLLQKYPELFQNDNLYHLLELLMEMLCNCNHQEIRTFIFECCEQLIKVMAERNLSMDLWLRVWETSLRSAGLNQNHCHPVLQTLIAWRIPPTSGLESLIRMFQSSMINPSNDSLRTLMILLTYYHLPESSSSTESVDHVALWELPINHARVLLLRWLCSTSRDVKLDMALVAKVLAILVVKVRHNQHSFKADSPESFNSLKGTSLESDYCVSAFEGGLLLPPSAKILCSATSPQCNYFSSIVDSTSLGKLEMLMETKCVELEQKFDELNEENAATQRTGNSSSVLTLKMELTCDVINHTSIMINLMSHLMEYGAIASELVSNSCLNKGLKRTMQLLKVLLPEVLNLETRPNESLIKEAHKTYEVLQSLCVLYGSDLLPSMSIHLREESLQEVLVPIVHLFSSSNIANLDVILLKNLGSFMPVILEGTSLNYIDHIHACCLNILTLYGCPKRGTELLSKQKTVISRILKVLADPEIYDMTLDSTFMMFYHCVSKILAYPCLDRDKHLIPILKLLQSACVHWNLDAEASSYILSLLKDIYKHALERYERLCSIKLLAPFKTRKFGPKYTTQLIFCFEEIFRVDNNSEWARWTNACSLRQAVDLDDIPQEALRKFEDDNGSVAIVEEVIYFLLNPFHEVRLAAVSCIAGLLSGSHHSLLWMNTMFQRLTVVISQMFISEEQNMHVQDAVSDCTSIVLHVLAAIIASSIKCYNQALLLLFRLVKRAKMDTDLIKKVFKMLVKPMKLQSYQSFVGMSLSSILHDWLLWGYQLKEFPYVLLNFTTFSEFFNQFKGIIMPVVWKHEDREQHLNFICQKVESEPVDLLKESFSSIYAQYLPILADRNSKSEAVKTEIKQYKLFAALVGNKRISELISSNIDGILIHLSNLVWDTCHHKILLGLDPSSTPSRPPFISEGSYSASLKYLQDVLETEESLLMYIARMRPIVLQKVLMQLRENVSVAVTLDQSIRALHSYIFFARAVASHLINGECSNLGYYLLCDITHTLLYLIHENESDPEKLDVCIGSCCFLTVLLQQLLPACAPILNDFLPTIVGFLIPFSQGTGVLAEKSLELLKLLVITNSTHFKDAISQLPPFPDTPGFEEINGIHYQYKYEGKEFTLVDEIKHFLNSSGCTNLANHNTLFDALNFLRKQLSEKKTELAILYQGLELTRGFSKDCKDSILHQLICKLVSLTASSNMKVQIEASCCLGELGPTELTTLVLRPMEGCINLVKGYSDPMLCVVVLAAHLSSAYLVNHDIGVVKRASCVLEGLMTCSGSDGLHSSNADSYTLKTKIISPFIPKQTTKSMPSLLSDEKKVVDVICDNDIWFPCEQTKHNEWVTNLACSFLTGLSADDVFRDLACLCKVKTSFAEEMLPVLFYLGLSYSTDVCHKLCIRLGQFFENHCSTSFKTSQTSVLSGSPPNIFLDGASVQCMLNVVNYVRLQMSALKDQKICLELNYLHIASAAQFCCAYLSSIMYLELWCNTETRHCDFDGASVAYVDYIYEIQPQEGRMLQNLLTKSYEQIGDKDALYGCGTSMLLNPKSRVNQYEYIGKWDKVLLYYDSKLSHGKDVDASAGLVNALQHCGHLQLLNTFVASLPSDQKNHLLPSQVECMWRLGQWGTPLSSSSKMTGFEWNQYSALQGIRDGNKALINDCVLEGRLSVLKSFAHSSLEICKTIYKPLAQLQALQEIEDFVKFDDTQEVMEKWKSQSTLPFSDIFLLEPILAQRAKLMENLNFQKNQEDSYSQNSNFLLQKITQHYLDTAALARKEDQIQIAELWLHSLSVMPHLSTENKRQICLEEAQLAWSSCQGSNDAGTTSLALNLLKSLLKDLQASEKVSHRKSPLLPKALILYGKWMAEARSENPQQIIEDYLEEALLSLNALPLTNATDEKIEAHCCLAQFADLEYQRITAYIKSESFQSKIQCMETLRSEANQVNQMKVKEDTRDLRQAVTLGIKFSEMDEEEIKNTYQEQNQFIELAMKHYLMSMKLGRGESLPVFRMVSLWLENDSHYAVNNLVISSMDSIQTYKLIVLLPQLAARIGDNMQNIFTKAIYKLLLRCCLEHPYHTLPLILALANSYEDFEGQVKPTPEARVIAAAQMLSELQKNKLVRKTVDEMDKLSKALISLAYAEIPAKTSGKGYNINKTEKICQLRNLQHAMLPIIALPVQTDAKYCDIIGIHSFDSHYDLAGGINRPKKIMCLGTDGIRRPLLVKGRDDLRQDAVMQQVFSIMNTLLKECKETKRRRLLIRTYKIVPLSQRCGVLEWCQNTCPLQEVLVDVHCRYFPHDWRQSVCMKKIENARQKTNLERLKVFKEICKNFHPAFRFFFTERFPTPAEWFDHRLAYVHSVATNSMVGYILGLGDRHVSNILIDKTTAELIHIDFGIAFEQGKVLPTPETVPFRLTRDLVDGMGLSGVEGVFRRSCEKAMAVLRRNQEKILTILEVLLYDPLYAWTITPKIAAKRQKGTSSSSSISSHSEVSNIEKNKMAQRALFRLKEKLQGLEDGPVSSIEGQVNRLIQQARDPSNLSRLFKGWQAYF